MEIDRTFNTLFMLSSVDGKISTGDQIVCETENLSPDFHFYEL